MVLDHSRLGVENKFLENKSGRIICVRQVYFTNSCQQIWVRANQPFILFSRSRLRRKSTLRRYFYHKDLVQNAVFHNFSRQIAFIQYPWPSKHAWTFSETVQKSSKITYTASRFLLLTCAKFAKKFKRVTLQHDKEFIVFMFLLMAL